MYRRYLTKSLKSPEEKNDLLAHDMEGVKEKKGGKLRRFITKKEKEW
jgi:hypothetical protein